MSTPWPIVKLGEVLNLCDRAVPSSQLTEINLAGVYSFGRGLFRRGPVSPAETSYKYYNKLVTDDYVISQPKAWEGALARVGPEFSGWYLSPVFPVFRANDERLDPKYLEWFGKREVVWKELLQKSHGMGARRESVYPEQFLSLEIPLPPLDEQRRIVAWIEELVAKISEARGLRQQVIKEIEQFYERERAAIFKTVNEKDCVPLQSIAILERGRFSHRPRNDPRFFGGNHPWIQIAEIEQADKLIKKWSETLNDDGLAISKKFPKGTVLVSIAATIGAVGILDFDCCIPDSIVGVTPRPGTDSEYLYHFLSYVRTHLESIAPQSTQKNINLQILSPLPVPKFPIIEQRRIVDYLDGLQAKVDTLKKLQSQTAVELEALLSSILDKAFRGEL